MQKDHAELIFEDYIKYLGRLIQHESVIKDDGVGPFGSGIQGALKEVLAICEDLGYKTYLDPEGYYAYAEIGQGDSMFGVLAHLDVVPVGDVSQWKHDPFTLTQSEGKLFGRGASDDKGPIISTLMALKILLDKGYELNQRVRFIFGSDEESLWRCMSAYTEKEEIPSAGFTPDSVFPLTYAEKGLLNYHISIDEIDHYLIKGGDAYNSVPDRAVIQRSSDALETLKELNYRYSVEGDEIHVHGKSVHAMLADEGDNAIVKAAQVLYEMNDRNALIEFIVEQCSDPNGLPIFGPISDEISGKLMFNLAKTDGHSIGIDIRYPVTCSKETVEDALKKVCSEYGLHLEEYDYLRAIHIDRELDFVKTLMDSYQSVSGDTKSQAIASGGATYARAMDNIVAFGASFPTSPKTAHQVDEYVLEADVKLAIEVYIEAFKRLVFKEKKHV